MIRSAASPGIQPAVAVRDRHPVRSARRRACRWLGRGGIALAALALLVWTLLPLYWLVMMSVVNRTEPLNQPANPYPHEPSLRQYAYALEVRLFPPEGGLIAPAGHNALPMQGWLNSLLVALAVVPLPLAVALPAAYAFSRFRFRYRRTLLAVLVLTRAYPPISVLIPFAFIMTRAGLDHSLAGLAFTHLSLTIPLVTWIMVGFLAGLPHTLERSARIDGLTRWQTLWRIIFPMARPGLAACAVIAFLVTWNEFFFALILTNGSSAQTAPLNVPTGGPAYIALSMLPALVLAILFQRSIRSLNI